MGDYAGSLSDARSERSLSASECITSRGFINKMSGEGSKPNDHRQSLSLAIGPSGIQEGSPCRDYASNGGVFQKIISRKEAQKIKKMQHLESPTMAASGPIIMRAVVPTAPGREVMTIGHYIKDDCVYGRKPNRKIKGKNQKGPSLSNVSKTGYTDGENVPGSSRMLLITMHTGKPGSSSQMALSSTSRHHVTLEDIEETSSPGCLPMEGKLKAPVGGDTERTDSTAPSSDKTSSLGNLANSSCVDREEQEKSMAPVAVDGDTEGTDSTATSSDKTSSQLGHLANSSCVDREEQKKDMAPVGGDTKDTDYTAPSSSDDDHLANSSCVDREEQKKAMAPVGGDTDTIHRFLHSTTIF
ncbi:unnamed protein product [Miscanthus lutarioriparius]|uniref:Uncharacterized protein n=1 Tax=Miscanthus lutarioriparius TaxID=422564 RepID=A0A811ME47_9POAL|nr:unnamed protein product [Miscanthus lutarioriparius]